MNPPPYIPNQSSNHQNSNQPLVTEQPKPMTAPSAPPAYQPFPEYNPNLSNQPNIKKKSKCRVIIPFPCYDIDITNFPWIKFIPNHVSDGKAKKH